MKSNKPLSRILSSILWSCLCAVLGLWIPPSAQGQTCTLTWPTNGAVLAVSNNIPAAAVCTPVPDGGSIASVSFLVNGLTAANVIVPPYSVVLSNLNPGTMTVQAVLNDNTGFAIPSDTVTVTVTGPPVPAPTNVFYHNPNLVLWLVASNAITDANGNVTNWADQSGYNNNAESPGEIGYPGNPPTLASNAINGLPAISFESGKFCSLVVPASTLLETTNEITSFVVLSPTTNNGGYFINNGWHSSPVGYYMEVWWQGYEFPGPNCFSLGSGLSGNGGSPYAPNWFSAIGWGDGTTETHVDGNISDPVAQWCIMGFNKVRQTTSGPAVRNATQPSKLGLGGPVTQFFISQFLDGIPNGGPTLVTGPIASIGSPTFIGAHGNSVTNYFFGGQIAELMIFNAALTGTNLDNLQAYLGSKYGIALALPPTDPGPVVSITPTNGAAVPGYTNFFVTVDATPASGTDTTIVSVDLQYLNWYGPLDPFYDISTLTTPPYQWLGSGYNWQETQPYTFTAIATDSRGVTTTTNISLYPVGPPATCVIISPTNGATVAAPASISVTATASEPGFAVTSVTFLANGVPVANLVSPPYTIALNTLNPGTLTLQAILRDNLVYTDSSGFPTVGYATTSAPISVTITGATNTFVGASNLVLWLEASQGVQNSAGNVFGWTDQSANGYSASASVSPPTFVLDATNNEPAISFDASDINYFEVNDATNLAITGDIAGFAVINVPSTNWGDDPVIWFEGGDWGTFGYNNCIPSPNGYYISGSGQPVLARGDGTNYEDVFTGNNSLPASGFAVVGFSVTNGSITQYLNGAFNGAGTASGTFAYADNDQQGLFIGARGCFDGTFLTGDIAELMLFNSSLSGASLTNIEAYLANKYGIGLVAPVPDPGPAISITSPTNGASVVGLSNFVVTASVTPATNADVSAPIVLVQLNGTLANAVTNSTYYWTVLAVPPGPLTLTVTASDNQGVSNSATSTITVAGTGAGNLVRNGGFETGDFTDWTQSTSDDGSSVQGGGVFGNEAKFFNTSPVSISQTLPTTPGTRYEISCYYNDPGADGTEFAIFWNGIELFNLYNVGTDGYWTNIVCEAGVTSNFTALEFQCYNQADVSYLSDIVVFPVSPVSPVLSTARQGASIVIRWPESYSGYNLQSATYLTGPWVPLSGGESNQITVTPSLTQQFYRLVSP